MANDSSKPYTEGRPAQEQGKRDKAAGVMGEAREKASEAAHDARQKAEKNLSSQKERATDQLANVSSALRETSGNLRTNDQESIAGVFESAAEQVDRFSGYFRNRSVGEIVDEVEDIARREPALFLGGAALIGILGSRFFKSSERRRMRDFDRGGSRYIDRDESRYIDRGRYTDRDRMRSRDDIDRDRLRTRDVSAPRTSDNDPFRTPGDAF